jgi:hypothetical protein
MVQAKRTLDQEKARGGGGVATLQLQNQNFKNIGFSTRLYEIFYVIYFRQIQQTEVRTDEIELLKKIFWTNPGRQRGRGRQKSRWIEGVEEDARKVGCRN